VGPGMAPSTFFTLASVSLIRKVNTSMFQKYVSKISGSILCSPFLAAFVLFTPANNVMAMAPVCSSAIIDQDGDGWGFENNQSCEFSSGHPPCSANAVINGNWGFENGRSCLVNASSSNNSGNNSGGAATSSSGSTRPECTSAAVSNGTPWGWENNQSCRWGASTATSTTTRNHPTCSSAAVNNGGGWGWENNRSCLFDNSSASTPPASSSGNTSTASVPATSVPVTSSSGGTPQCSANANDNGDGWGFEFGRSCLWGDVRQTTALSNEGAAPPPVSAASNGFDSAGKPICLTDASDGNGDGFGYENNRTCTVSSATATAQNPLLNRRWCQPWAEISYDKYVLQNNTWNDSDVWTDNWSQCIELGGSRGNYVAKWDYNWLRRDEGNEYSVKSYPQVYYGRKTRNTTSGTPAELGVPANINNLPNFKVRYRYSETGSAERNVALESFFHTSCEAEEWNKHFEMMVWVNSPSTKTPGRLVTEATIDGKEWEVYTNPSLSWGYVAFVEKTPSNAGWLDWNEFVNWTRYQGPSFGVWSIGDDTCMGAIEIGTETFWGTGTFTLHEFAVTR